MNLKIQSIDLQMRDLFQILYLHMPYVELRIGTYHFHLNVRLQLLIEILK